MIRFKEIVYGVFRSKIGFTILLLVTGIFVAMNFSRIQNNRMYVILADSAKIEIDSTALSKYYVTIKGVAPNVLQIPPAADGLPLLVPTANFLMKYKNMSPSLFNIILTYQAANNNEEAISIFEASHSAYDPTTNTLTWSAQIFADSAIPNTPLTQVSAFISLK